MSLWEQTLLDRWLRLPWDGVVVHFHEIALKGGNRRPFLQTLGENLKRIVAPLGGHVEAFWDRLLVHVRGKGLPELLEATAKVFGVAYVAPIRFLPCDLDVLTEVAIETYRAVNRDRATFAVRVRRVDKKFPMTSRELERLIGQRVAAATDAPVDLEAPQLTLSFRLYEGHAYLVGPHLHGPGGLPVGVTGKTLTLFSGGIDSPVAAWLIMRRGCLTDFIHFHAARSPREVRDSKIPALAERIVRPQGVTGRLFLVPYHAFQMAVLMSKIPPPLELVLFRRFMVRVATCIAKEQGHQALVTGDNLGQVASQTMENLTAVEDATDLPLLRPLLTYDKDEIIRLARHIGTYDLSIQPYKDCCSLIARHPKTRPKLSAVRSAEESLPLNQIITATLKEMEVWVIGE